MVMAQIELQHAFGRIDPVSGLSNRNQFVEDVEDLARDYPGEPRLAVAVDLIDPTQHTAALHAVGPLFTDDLMRTASQRLRRLVSQTTPVYQIGPTHLGYLLPNLNERELVRQIRPDLGGTGHGSGAQSTSLTIRAVLGVAPFRLGEATPQDVLRAATVRLRTTQF